MNVAAVFLVLVVATTLSKPSLQAAEPHPDKIEILELLESGRFEALDKILRGYQIAYESGRVPEKYVVRAFYSFRNTDPGLEAPLNRWVIAVPGSFAPFLARGMYTEYLGWADRWASKADKKRLQAMRKYFAAAIRDYQTALRINPGLGLSYGRLMMMGLVTRNAKLKKRAYAQGLAADPRTFYLRALRMQTLLPQWGGSAEKMQAFAGEIMRDRPDEPIARYLEGYISFHTAEKFSDEDKRKATVHYDRAVAIGEYGQFHFERGRNQYFLGNYAQALASFNRALEVNPQVPVFLGQRGWALSKLGRLDKALADFDLAIRLDALDPELLRDRALLQMDRKQYDAALKDLDKALVYGRDDIAVWQSRLEIHTYGTRDTKAALVDAWQLFKLDPGRFSSWRTLTIMLWNRLMELLFHL